MWPQVVAAGWVLKVHRQAVQLPVPEPQLIVVRGVLPGLLLVVPEGGDGDGVDVVGRPCRVVPIVAPVLKTLTEDLPHGLLANGMVWVGGT